MLFNGAAYVNFRMLPCRQSSGNVQRHITQRAENGNGNKLCLTAFVTSSSEVSGKARRDSSGKGEETSQNGIW